MPIVIEPRPHPSTLDYMPAGAKPYRVTNGDSWWTLADRPDVKGSGLSANDLCYLNFRTRNPAEINWYLYHKVGCRTTTVDGHNYCFSAADRPGVVYLPAAGPPHPVNEIRPIAAQHRLNAWLGMAGSAGTQFIVAGIETMVGYVASLDDAETRRVPVMGQRGRASASVKTYFARQLIHQVGAGSGKGGHTR